MALFLAAIPPQAAAAQRDTVRFDFEAGNMQDWTVVEGSFGKLLTDRLVFHHTKKPYNKRGVFFLSTLETKDDKPDDSFTGIVESPVFVPSSPDMSLLVGGGDHSNTFVGLFTLAGKELCRAQGKRSQTMQSIEWNVPEAVGQPVFLRVVDKNTGSWGHVTLDHFEAKGRIDSGVTRERLENRAQRKRRTEARALLGAIDIGALRQAIADLTATFPKRYPQGTRFLQELARHEARLEALESGLKRGRKSALRKAQAVVEDLRALQREALLANPLVCEQPILFVARKQYVPDHHNTATIFQTGEINTASFEGGGAIKTFNPATGEIRTLIETRDGMVRDPEIHFDGRRIVFAMRQNIDDDYHVYEMNADGSGVRQLTRAAGVADIDPLYLPDDSIVFSSTREPKYCMCNRHIMANLFRMEADGANVHQIGKSTLFEGHGSLIPDGRILYDRWEYVDRNFGDAQGLWTVFPDGTNHALYWGNNTWSPGSVIDARVLPNGEQAIAVFGSCHDRPWGALALIDRRLGLDDRPPVVRTWPEDAIRLMGDGSREGYGFDNFKKVALKYEDPYPLSDKYFLCSRMTGEGERMALYLLDVFGNEILLHSEAPGCFDPMPLTPKPRPPQIPARRDFENATGRFYVADVYQSTHMAGLERGAVKFLRVVESPEKRFWTPMAWNGQGQHAPAMNWHDFCNKRVLGTVPVEADGSAYFEAPADTFVFFQLLDAKGMMIQSMRSGTIIQSGEQIGCVGCHEERRSAPPAPNTPMPLAMRRAPSQLDGWYGAPRLFNYMAEVQPVFDKHCVSCHDYGKKGGGRLNLAGDRTMVFNTSYNELWRSGLIKPIGAGPAVTQPAYSWGSHASALVSALLKGHHSEDLGQEGFDRIVTWLDLNAPYYPSYASAYPDNLAGRSPLSPPQVARLSELTGVQFDKLADWNANLGPQVSFVRPEKSPCLEGIDKNDHKARQEAIAIIAAGKAALEKHPRADMAGFTPAEADGARQLKYAQRQDAEQRNRAAIRAGTTAYDARTSGAWSGAP
ncbi:MAG: hypothetical protein GWP08_14810 [Nitrospiraceae bacterium]|nr:hypothetical protein [Nitrospiraceae bacterium]